MNVIRQNYHVNSKEQRLLSIVDESFVYFYSERKLDRIRNHGIKTSMISIQSTDYWNKPKNANKRMQRTFVISNWYHVLRIFFG